MIQRLALLQAAAPGGARTLSEWDTWPFGTGYGESALFIATKVLFIAAIIGFLVLFLRFLFGPGGPLREEDFRDDPASGAAPGAREERDGHDRRAEGKM